MPLYTVIGRPVFKKLLSLIINHFGDHVQELSPCPFLHTSYWKTGLVPRSHYALLESASFSAKLHSVSQISAQWKATNQARAVISQILGALGGGSLHTRQKVALIDELGLGAGFA